jgi:DNA-binding NarL/FixJ family response regulator
VSGRELTVRQVAYLEAVARGESNDQIARRFQSTSSGVGQELTRIYHWLGALNRAHAVYLAVKGGVIR